MKRITGIFFLLLFIFSYRCFAALPPSNDDPCNAINLDPTPNCNNYHVYSTVGATASTGVPDPGCAGYVGGDVWFKVTVPCATSLFFDTNFGVVLDGGMAIYSGTCDNLTLISCDDNSSGNGNMPSITLTSLVSGSTVWVRFWSNNNATAGTFGICVTIPPPPPPGASCPTAGPFCTGSTYTFPNLTNNPDGLGAGGIYGCLGSSPNPVFYYMQIENPGDLSIHITQYDAGGTLIDVDFCCWGPFNTYGSMCPGLSPTNIVDCSYSGSGDETCTIPGAQAGQFYMLLLTNFSQQPGTIHFEQSAGTASTTCGIVCTITAANTGPVCAGQPFNLTSNIPGGLPGGTYSWTGPNCFSSNSPNPTGVIAPSTPGSYVYTVTATTVDGISCNASTTVVVLSAITPTATKTDETCPGLGNGTITVSPPATGGPFVYTLNPANVVQNNNPVFTGLATGTYTITVQPATGCSGNVSPITIGTSASTPTASASTGNTSCPTSSDGTITITPPGAGGPFIYTLNPGNIVHNNNPVYTGLVTGTYTITFSNAGGCNGTVSPNPIVQAGSVLTATATHNNTTCANLNDGTITVAPPAAGGPFIYTLNPGNIVHNNNPVYTGLAADTYTITVTNAAGCSGNVAPNTIVQPGPALTATAVPATTTCPGVNDGIITITPQATGGPFVYTLNPGNVVHNNNPVYTGLATGTYTITFTNAAGCNGTVSSNTFVQAGPAITANAPTLTNPPCTNINDGTITLVPTAAGVYTYVLNPGLPGQVTQANNPVFTGLAPGNYTYNFTNATGCIGSGNTTLTTHSALAIAIVKIKPSCFSDANGIITLSASGGLAGYEYALSPFTAFQPTGTFNGLVQGSYTFRVRDAAGCIKDTTVNLDQPAKLAATAVSTTGTCNGNDGTITVTGHDGTLPYTYSIDAVNYQTSQSFTVSGASTPGAPYANVSVKDDNGCIATSTIVYVPLTDNMSPLKIGNDTTICAEQKVTFHPQVSAQATIFSWTTIPDASLTNTLDNITILNSTATPLDTTTYVLNAQWGVCSRKDTITINILHKPIPNAGKDTAVCFDRTIAILNGSASNLSGTVNYEWSDTTNLQTPHSAITVATPATTEVFVLTVTDNYGCHFSESDHITIVVQPPVPAYAGHDTIAVIGEPHQLLATGGVSYAWTPSNDLNFSNIANPLATLDHDQLFQVTVTDVAGCIGNDNVYVQVYPGPSYHIPNAFSPNGDGLNDIFRVVPAGISYTEWFRIFNRFGEMVFESNQWLKGWDGTFRGKKQPVGNYVWVLKGRDKNNKVVELKGTVVIVL